MIRRNILCALGASLIAATFGAMAQAPKYPARPVKVVVPWPAGGNADITTRAVINEMSNTFGQPLVVENLPGASGANGTAQAAKAAHDGYTLVMLASISTINVSLVKNAPFDLIKDFEPVGMITSTSLALVVPASLPVRSVKELIEYARARPNGATFASAGVGTGGHLTAELFKKSTKLPMVHVPYKGAAPAVNDLMGGHVDMFFDTLPSAMTYAKSGKLRILAVTDTRRSDLIPDVPTFVELGLPDLVVSVWTALAAPAGTDPEIVSRVNSELNRALRDKAVVQRLAAIGSVPQQSSPEQFRSFIRSEVSKWAEVVKSAGITPE